MSDTTNAPRYCTHAWKFGACAIGCDKPRAPAAPPALAARQPTESAAQAVDCIECALIGRAACPEHGAAEGAAPPPAETPAPAPGPLTPNSSFAAHLREHPVLMVTVGTPAPAPPSQFNRYVCANCGGGFIVNDVCNTCRAPFVAPSFAPPAPAPAPDAQRSPEPVAWQLLRDDGSPADWIRLTSPQPNQSGEWRKLYASDSWRETGYGHVISFDAHPPAAPPEPAADADVARVAKWLREWADADLRAAAREQRRSEPFAPATIAKTLGYIAAATIEQQARELAELREQRDNARAVTRDICEEWNEECDCEKLPMALGHGEQCKAVSIRVAKAALRERVERAEADLAAARECIAAADAREVLEVRAVFDSWRKNEVCPSEWGAFFAGYQRGVAATKGSSEPGLHIPGTPTHTIEGLPACVQGACAEDVAVRLPDKGRAAANEAATRAVPAGANPAPSP